MRPNNRSKFNVALGPQDVFESRTVEALAARIGGGSATAMASIPRREPGAQPVLSFSQQRLWFLDQLTPGSATYNVAYALLLQGDLNREALTSAFTALVERHEVLRTSWQPVRTVQS